MTRTRTARRPAAPRISSTRTRQRRTTTEVRWANNLKAIRTDAEKSQTDVARAVGISQRLVSAIENGDRSGREHMDQLAAYLRVSPDEIFPHYDFYTFEEAAELMGVSSSIISARVDEKVLPFEEFGGTNLIPKSALDGVQVRLRPVKSKRARLRDLLRANPEGLTSSQLLLEFAPFDYEPEMKLWVCPDGSCEGRKCEKENPGDCPVDGCAHELRSATTNEQTDENELRTSRTIQQLLARFSEFEKVGHDAETGLLLWTLRSE